ncbi:peptide-methionine (R)-S-oxide reductase [Roseicitreum antarcticum]|uniref:peptide-methionine (R)-S-oxide reductase n=1 Tax=Roseicitreum antarcticum TaxID=564137 RepID=A0A1H2WFH0_9RHOB|nr:peptide-methionine (R)-S-oxide reductase [Roseicitreum antarcticum]
MLTRRKFMMTTAALTVGGLAARAGANTGTFEITRTEAEWRAQLTPAQFAVLREEATERAFTNELMGERSPLLKEDRVGNYNCAGCALPVYRSETKYDSQTGWPSYWDAIEDAVGTREDRSYLFMVRTEVHCARCGGHLGHIFDDGPEPTGARHCINGLAMTFTPDATGVEEGHPVTA